MTKPLLERQVSLIAHLTSGAAIFGRGGDPAPGLEGLDPALLRVEAQFSYAKRMEKITAVLPKTFELLGGSKAVLVRAFVENCPPATLSRLENARQFHQFLTSRWLREEPDPPHLRDVAACEIACAEAEVDPERRGADRTADADCVQRGAIRRSPDVILLRCAYDVRPIFEAPLPNPPSLAGEGGVEAVPAKRDTPLVIAMPPGADGPQVLEVVPAIFDLLAALDNWTDPEELDVPPGFSKLLADLAAHGLIEVR